MDRAATDKILAILRPFGANWSGTLGRGDLVIPERDISRVVGAIVESIDETSKGNAECGDGDVFEVLRETRGLPSVQDQVAALRSRFRIYKR